MASKENWADIHGVPELNESWAFDDNDWMNWVKGGLRRVKDVKVLTACVCRSNPRNKFHRCFLNTIL